MKKRIEAAGGQQFWRRTLVRIYHQRISISGGAEDMLSQALPSWAPFGSSLRRMMCLKLSLKSDSWLIRRGNCSRRLSHPTTTGVAFAKIQYFQAERGGTKRCAQVLSKTQKRGCLHRVLAPELPVCFCYPSVLQTSPVVSFT